MTEDLQPPKNPPDFSQPGKAIKPLKSTGGPSFGLIPRRAATYGQSGYVPFGGFLVADPNAANEKLFTAESYDSGTTSPGGGLGTIRPKLDDFYRIYFYCSFRMQSASPSVSPTTKASVAIFLLDGTSKTLGYAFNTFRPSGDSSSSFHMSRILYITANTPIHVAFSITTPGRFRPWNGNPVISEARAHTGFYLTKLTT